MFEKLMEILIALTAALKENTAALKGASSNAGTPPAKEKEKAKDKTTTASGPGVPEVRTAASAYLDAQKDKKVREVFVKELNEKYGSTRLTEAPADKFAEIIKALGEETAKVLAGGSSTADSGI